MGSTGHRSDYDESNNRTQTLMFFRAHVNFICTQVPTNAYFLLPASGSIFYNDAARKIQGLARGHVARMRLWRDLLRRSGLAPLAAGDHLLLAFTPQSLKETPRLQSAVVLPTTQHRRLSLITSNGHCEGTLHSLQAMDIAKFEAREIIPSAPMKNQELEQVQCIHKLRCS